MKVPKKIATYAAILNELGLFDDYSDSRQIFIQKIGYLLSCCGCDSDYEFRFSNNGPYCRDLYRDTQDFIFYSDDRLSEYSLDDGSRPILGPIKKIIKDNNIGGSVLARLIVFSAFVYAVKNMRLSETEASAWLKGYLYEYEYYFDNCIPIYRELAKSEGWNG